MLATANGASGANGQPATSNGTGKRAFDKEEKSRGGMMIMIKKATKEGQEDERYLQYVVRVEVEDKGQEPSVGGGRHQGR